MNEKLLSLFTKYSTSVTIDDVTLFIRLPTEQAINDCRFAALLASNALRKKLRDPSSDEYAVYIEPIADFTDDELRNLCLLFGIKNAARDYRNTHPKPKLPKLSDYPTLEEQEEYAQAEHRRDAEYEANLREYLEATQADLMQALQKAPRDQLIEMYKKYRIDDLAETAFSSTFQNELMARSIYVDRAFKQPAFSPEQYMQLPQKVRSVLEQALASITIDDEDLKK